MLKNYSHHLRKVVIGVMEMKSKKKKKTHKRGNYVHTEMRDQSGERNCSRPAAAFKPLPFGSSATPDWREGRQSFIILLAGRHD